MSSPEIPEQQPIARNFAEFLGAMQFLSGQMNKDMSIALEVDDGQYSRWLYGKQIPYESHDTKFIDIFGLTQEQIDNLRKDSQWILKQEQKQQQEEADLSIYREKLLGSFVVRAEKGPPLNEQEVELIKFLIQSEEEA